MKLKEYIDKLKVLAKKYPEADLVWFDPKDTSYYRVVDSPVAGEYVPDDNELYIDNKKAINAVCVN